MDAVKAALEAQELDKDALGNAYGDLSLLFGETPVDKVGALLEKIRAAEPSLGSSEEIQGAFVDIGSGRGHVVLAAAALAKWTSGCIGVELVSEHVAEAEKALQKLRGLEEKALLTNCHNVKFINGDIFDHAEVLKEASLVFCYDLAFPTDLRKKLGVFLSENLREGALVLVMHSDPIISSAFVPVMPLTYIKMTWGDAPARLYKKAPGAYEAWLKTHESQLKLVPESLWNVVFEKMMTLEFDIGKYAQFARVFADEDADLVMTASTSIPKESTAFIIDHMWTVVSKEDAIKSLETVPNLKERIQRIVTAEPEVTNEHLLKKAQPFLASYVVKQGEKSSNVLFMLDEVGSRLRRRFLGRAAELQSGSSNLRMIPIYSFDFRIAFSVAWPIVDIAADAVLVADHEQGWDVKQSADILKAHGPEEGLILPEMKEFSAKSQLNEIMNS